MKCVSVLCVLCVGSSLFGVSVSAQPGSALEFDGNDHVMIADPIDLRGPLTLEAWIRPDAFDGGRIISNRYNGAGYELDIDSNGNLRFTTNFVVRAFVNISEYLGQYIHVAATWAGPSPADGAIFLYVNGQLAASSAFTGEVGVATSTLAIGSFPGGSSAFTGAIDQVRIFSTVVAPETIDRWRTRMTTSEHPDFAHLEGAWDFEEGSGQTTADLGGVGGRDGQLGFDAGVDDSDPTWVVSGMTPHEVMSLGELKALFR